MSEEAPLHEFDLRLLNPNWTVVENHYKCQIPAILKEYYSDPQKILHYSFDLRTPVKVEGHDFIHVEFFTPLDSPTIEHFEGFERFLDIASDGGEGIFFIDPNENNPEVHLFILDSYDLFPTGLSLNEFLCNPRLEPTDYWKK